MGNDDNLDTATQSIREGSSKRIPKIELRASLVEKILRTLAANVHAKFVRRTQHVKSQPWNRRSSCFADAQSGLEQQKRTRQD
jgi:hypothetical protein